MSRLATAVAVCLMATLGAVLPQARAFADAECMFYIEEGIGAEALCPEWPQTPGTTGGSPVAPADDRINATPTGWWTYNGVGPDTLSSLLNTNDARPTDIRVVSTSPLLFSVTEVSNTGAYASGYWWYYGITLPQVNWYLSANNARLVSAVRYGGVYAVVMVPNTGANYKAWGWCDTDYAGISACLGTTNRLTNIEAYAANGFVVIFVDNAEGYYWCWYVGIDRAGLNNVCGGQSILDISANSDGSLNVASVSAPQQSELGDFATPTDSVNCAIAGGTRPLFTTPYQASGVTRWVSSFAYNS